MKDYTTCTDEELIQRIRAGEYEITNYILEKYKGLAKAKSKSMFILGGDTEDIIQEGMIGLYKAIQDYEFDKDTKFRTFAEICISRQIYTAIQNSQRLKHTPLNQSISISQLMPSGERAYEDAVEHFRKDFFMEQTENSPEEMILRSERMKVLQEAVVTQLSTLERQVFELFMTGMDYHEIAKVLDRDEKSMDNALQRIRIKLKKKMEKW